MNEAETRAEHIDPALKTAGWGVVEGSVIRCEYIISPGRIEGRHQKPKPEIADYVLIYRDHKLAALDALKKSLLHQAFTGQLDLSSQSTHPQNVSKKSQKIDTFR